MEPCIHARARALMQARVCKCACASARSLHNVPGRRHTARGSPNARVLARAAVTARSAQDWCAPIRILGASGEQMAHSHCKQGGPTTRPRIRVAVVVSKTPSSGPRWATQPGKLSGIYSLLRAVDTWFAHLQWQTAARQTHPPQPSACGPGAYGKGGGSDFAALGPARAAAKLRGKGGQGQR